ncbi:type II toxin-antitoxin system VapC family toxin [Thermofilum pendens]|uniref:type II toxin-antitoxin system VapC family toxin n=1 Tax=Thermofilum pendens TaxID=2269 RepID=UPI000ACECF79|nr:type II toxin-antitoxin system VapC family toxin [Thermofilum pendens]
MVYLDSSAVVKRYVLEPGSEVVSRVYYKALNGESTLSFSAWNIGEVLGVLDKYYRRGWLSREDYEKARFQFLGETIRLLKLRLLKIVPVRTKLLIETWRIVEKYHVYEADALQLVSAKYVGAEEFYTGDEQLHKIAAEERVGSVYVG